MSSNIEPNKAELHSLKIWPELKPHFLINLYLRYIPHTPKKTAIFKPLVL